MTSSKKGTTLAEVIISFTLMVMLIGIMIGAIQFSNAMMTKADSLRATADLISVKLSNSETTVSDSTNTTLSFSDGTLSFSVPLKLQSKNISLTGTATYNFLVFTDQ